ncbi:MAG: methyltransferase domain-containing protein [Woeseiaceae bacterium]|nr:methyltransferase domain-containing protein [Woeseiaceae bacterium]
MASKPLYGEAESSRTERAYLSPEIERQRRRILERLSPKPGEHIVDIGCGPGLLAREFSVAVKDDGRVTGLDASTAMLDLARKRCGNLSNVAFIEGDATDLEIGDASADAVTCVQVLLYVPDVRQALAEIFRVLKPGGRAVIMETDWRSTVLHSHDEELTESIIDAWDRKVASPRLPARLRAMLRDAGFGDVAVEAFPIISTDATPEGFSMAMMAQSADAAVEQGTISQAQSEAWLAELRRLGADDQYFFCVNRFLFTARKA